MNPIYTKYKDIVVKINFLALLLFVFWLPLKDNYFPIIISFWIFTWLLLWNFKLIKFNLTQKLLFLALFFYFTLTIISLFRSTNIDDGLFEIQEKLSLIFFPIILSGSSEKIKINHKTILIVFLISNLIASIYCLSFTLIDCLRIENGSYSIDYHITQNYYNQSFWELVNSRYNRFSYKYLSLFKHPSYFSMYITFSIMSIIYFFRKKMVSKRIIRILLIFLIVFFAIMLYLLQSRAAFITAGVILVIIPIVELQKRLKKRFIFFFIIFLAGTIIFLSTNKRIHENIKEFKELIENDNNFSYANSDLRFRLWYTSIHVISVNFWFGTTPANLTEALVKKYEELGFKRAANERLNSHNQYLETFAGLGIFGFLSLMFIIIYTFIISIKQRHYLLFFLMIILSINFLFESMLNRMAGVLFMMFFISLLVFSKTPYENSKQK
ncbi:MAG: O-antigen ligase family protein, partial [Bacteroidales bacterium]|nr:O-antigen ligase family protein [Bacteroidales bacterium]